MISRKKQKEIEVRDLREKFFMVDDAYFNGYARKCGDSASLVYMILCRHVGTDQSCFPSVRLIADKLGFSERRVTRAIRMLEAYGVITVDRVRGGNSLYFLMDKSKWKKDPVSYLRRGPARKATKKAKSGMKITYGGDS